MAPYSQAQIEAAMRRQERFAATVGTSSRVIDQDSGAHAHISVDPVLFHNAREAHGCDIWKDDSWVNDMKRKFPSLARTPTSG